MRSIVWMKKSKRIRKIGQEMLKWVWFMGMESFRVRVRVMIKIRVKIVGVMVFKKGSRAILRIIVAKPYKFLIQKI